MLKARYKTINMQFTFPAGTSRGTLLEKPSSFLILEKDGFCGIGECSLIPGLSIDPQSTYESKLAEVCFKLNNGVGINKIELTKYPSINFGLETALLDLNAQGSKQLFKNGFSKGETGIPINGLIWMGKKDFMETQIHSKILAGFRCLKLKVGALDFETEFEIIRKIRQKYNPSDLEIRLDANGAFSIDTAMHKLNKLSELHVHSIEQPIKAGQWDCMSQLCSKSPIPIALDEELIGLEPNHKILKKIKPSYIILKPSLIGGLKVSEKWIEIAKELNIKWWNTSALEANIGLNAICQWTYSLKTSMPQGLGTGQLFCNNIPSPLEISNANIFYDTSKKWNLNQILS